MRDPVCGEEVDGLRARAVAFVGGRFFYFCSPEHRDVFARDPGSFVVGSASSAVPLAAPQQTSLRSGASGAVRTPAPVATSTRVSAPTPAAPVVPVAPAAAVTAPAPSERSPADPLLAHADAQSGPEEAAAGGDEPLPLGDADLVPDEAVVAPDEPAPLPVPMGRARRGRFALVAVSILAILATAAIAGFFAFVQR